MRRYAGVTSYSNYAVTQQCPCVYTLIPLLCLGMKFCVVCSCTKQFVFLSILFSLSPSLPPYIIPSLLPPSLLPSLPPSLPPSFTPASSFPHLSLSPSLLLTGESHPSLPDTCILVMCDVLNVQVCWEVGEDGRVLCPPK